MQKIIFLILCILSLGLAETTANISVYFSPQDHCDKVLIGELEKAQREVNVAIYSLTKPDIAEALIKLADRGVKIQVVMDHEQAAGKYAKDEYLISQNIPVILDKHAGLMHDKFAVIDGQTVLTGSYNWTAGATYKNDENLVIIRSTENATVYNAEFARLWRDNQEQ